MFGEIGKLNHQGGLVQCHICGKFYDHLGAHVKRKHFVESDDYKKEFGLKMTTGLIGQDLAEKRRESTEHLREYSDICATTLKNLTPAQRKKNYVSLQERQEQKETKLKNLQKASEAHHRKYSETIELICPHCSKTFNQPKHNKNQRKFCSAKCYTVSAQRREQGIILRKSFGRGKILTPK